jgi:hypothetical protein
VIIYIPENGLTESWRRLNFHITGEGPLSNFPSRRNDQVSLDEVERILI